MQNTPTTVEHNMKNTENLRNNILECNKGIEDIFNVLKDKLLSLQNVDNADIKKKIEDKDVLYQEKMGYVNDLFKLLKEAEQENKEQMQINKYLAGIFHDIRSPLIAKNELYKKTYALDQELLKLEKDISKYSKEIDKLNKKLGEAITFHINLEFNGKKFLNETFAKYQAIEKSGNDGDKVDINELGKVNNEFQKRIVDLVNNVDDINYNMQEIHNNILTVTEQKEGSSAQLQDVRQKLAFYQEKILKLNDYMELYAANELKIINSLSTHKESIELSNLHDVLSKLDLIAYINRLSRLGNDEEKVKYEILYWDNKHSDYQEYTENSKIQSDNAIVLPVSFIARINNLVSNSFKFTKEGEIKIYIDYSGQGKFDIEISDTGVGVDQEKLNTLNQGIIQQSEDKNSAGIGLSNLVVWLEKYGGKIEYYSRENHQNEGFRARIYGLDFSELQKKKVELLGVKTITQQITELIINKEKKSLKDLRVGICDDDKLILDSLKQNLQTLGIENIIQANSAEKLKKLITEKELDIIISDENMGNGMLGTEFSNDDFITDKKVTFVLLSGDGIEQFSQKKLDNIDYLATKPIKIQSLSTLMSLIITDPKLNSESPLAKLIVVNKGLQWFVDELKQLGIQKLHKLDNKEFQGSISLNYIGRRPYAEVMEDNEEKLEEIKTEKNNDLSEIEKYHKFFSQLQDLNQGRINVFVDSDAKLTHYYHTFFRKNKVDNAIYDRLSSDNPYIMIYKDRETDITYCYEGDFGKNDSSSLLKKDQENLKNICYESKLVEYKSKEDFLTKKEIQSIDNLAAASGHFCSMM